MKGLLISSSIQVNPSVLLINYIKNMELEKDMPSAICNIRTEKSTTVLNKMNPKSQYLINYDDQDFIKTLDLISIELSDCFDNTVIDENDSFLTITDLLWVWNKIKEKTKSNGDPVYLHELLEDSAIVLPNNEEIPRNEELDKRCNLLRIQQENREYKAITKNVDNVRKPLPEDTISYQMKQINKQLIAVAQFIISVLAGFTFGFHGIELMVGSLDFGFRLLLGVICSLVIALAELYF